MSSPRPVTLEPRDGADGFAFRLVPGADLGGRWIALTYLASRSDPVRRPMLRFLLPDGHQDALLPGAVVGRARFVGLVPAGTTDILLAVDAEAVATGRWRIERLEPLGASTVVGGTLRRRPAALAVAAFFAVRRNPRRFRNSLRGALAVTPLRAYAAWRAERERPYDPAIDAPSEPPALRVLVLLAAGASEAATRTGLAAQTHADWELAVVPAGGHVDPHALATRAAAQAVLVLGAGDVLAPEALALLAHRLRADSAVAAYGDHEIVRGGRRMPALKPAWSPDLARGAVPYPGRPLLVATAILDGTTAPSLPALEEAIARRLAHERVARVPQVLCRIAVAPMPRPQAPRRPLPDPLPPVSIVMPSKDRLDLVSRSLGGVLDETDYPDLEIVLVDNGSTDPAVRAFYAERARDPRLRILERPGPFNFSALNNDGVALARGQVVVLLNNDVAILHPGWLTELVREAVRPDIGAVGAKLLHGDGRLQHAGVVVGLGGYAGHILRRRAAETPGHLGRLTVPHEVSAVTAACLAVTREKYLAVGGLDAQSFPVDFNDVDFCLRLGARGWRTIWTPHARLAHLESVSRGQPTGAARARFEAEAARFADRWRDVIRDDPFYHPALSVTAFGEDLE